MEVDPNSPQSTGSSVVPNALGNIQRPGEYLRQIRVSQKRDLTQIAQDLNIAVKALTALEQDDYKALPEATFIKGYYRSYAKYLGVDATAIIQRFDEIYVHDTGLAASQELNKSPIKIMGKLPGSNRTRNQKWLKRILIAIVTIAVLWAAIAAIKNWSDKRETTPEQPQTQVEVLSDEAAPETTGDTLILSFNRPTSVNIIDSTGKVLATGRQSSTVTLNGESPFQIRLDDATAVSLTLNDEVISLSPYTVNGKAEFRLSR